MKETRNSNGVSVEDRIIRGYAAVFNTWSKPLASKNVRFIEKILPGAMDGLIEVSDIIATYNHNEDLGVLARSTNGTGTLKLSIDNNGLYYEFEAPNSPLGDTLIEGINRGDITSNSFAFSVRSGGDTFKRNSNGLYEREISKMDELFDIAIVSRSAYRESVISSRCSELAEEEELEIYYKTLKEELNG